MGCRHSPGTMWSEFLRIGKENCVIALTSSQPFSSVLVMSQVKLFRHEWVWIKNRGSNFANTVREPMKEHENVLIFSRGKWTYNKQMQERTGGGLDRVKHPVKFNSKSKNYRDFEEYSSVPVGHDNLGESRYALSELRVPSSWQKFNTETGLHPTQKPVDLMRYLIRTYSNQGDVVLDCCMGSGSTGVGALMEKRDFIGIEKDLAYFNIAKERIDGMPSDLSDLME